MRKLNWSDIPVLGACIASPAIIAGLNSVFPLWVLPWTADFNVKRSSVMLAYALTSLLTIFLMPFVGRLLIRVPARLLMTIGAFTASTRPARVSSTVSL